VRTPIERTGIFFVLLLLSSAVFAQAPNESKDVAELEHLIHTYAASIDAADTNLANEIWSDAPEVLFIHPLGQAHGRAQIESEVYRKLMGDTFSERKLTARDISVHVYGEAAWSEFNWDFVAKYRKDGSALHTQGRETQVYHRENGRWRIVHVHYSGQVASGNSKGF